MGSLNPLKKQKVPQIQIVQPKPAPTVGNSPEDLAAAAKKEKDKQKKQAGKAATILTSGSGLTGDDTSGLAKKVLLGG